MRRSLYILLIFYFHSIVAIAQIIDDSKASTLATSTSIKISGKTFNEKAKNVGLDIAKKAQDKKIKEVLFDRGGYLYTGNIKALADGAREGGLRF